MAESLIYRELGGTSRRYWRLLALLAVPLALGAVSYFYIEHYGHIVTGMDNQIVWGMPHVFAVFLVIAATGALNVAMAASVFGKTVPPLLETAGAARCSARAGGGVLLLHGALRPYRDRHGQPDRLGHAACVRGLSRHRRDWRERPRTH